MHRYFVTGTDTDVGKTRVAAALALALRRSGCPTLIVKLIQTGLSGSLPGDGERAGRLAGVPYRVLFRFEKPADPWSAARAQGSAELHSFELVRMLDALEGSIVVEGTGGLMVPLNRDETFADIAASAKLEAIVTVGLRLGCINHALLTLDVCARSGIHVAGLVLVERWGPVTADHIEDVSRVLGQRAPVLGVLPFAPDEDTAIAGSARIFERIALSSYIERTRARVSGARLTSDRQLVSDLLSTPRDQVGDLLKLADEVRAQNCGDGVAVEVLYNAKRGGCSEDCSFCSQSARYTTDVEAEPLASVDDFVHAAQAAHDRGAAEFCIVVAVRGPSMRLLERVCSAVRRIKSELPLTVAVSLGILTDEHLAALVDAGVDKVNHNLETSERYFPSICTTHTYKERWETCLRIKRHGLSLCCGGIAGMGEAVEDRVDFLMALQELDPEEVPINFLNPRPGTPLADQLPLDSIDALRFVATARIAMPKALIRLAGGREVTLQGLQDLGMRGGASGIVLGDYLTTKGRADAADFAMLERLGLKVLG